MADPHFDEKSNFFSAETFIGTNITIDDPIVVQTVSDDLVTDREMPEIRSVGDQPTNTDIKVIKVRRYSQYKDFFERLNQEGVPHVSKLKKKKLSDFMDFHRDTKIPLIEHVVYLFRDDTSSMASYLIDKIRRNYANLKSKNKEWKLFFWTNNENCVPKSLRDLVGLEVKNINSLKHHRLYENLSYLIQQSTTSTEYKAILTQASDVVRIMALHEVGGIYHDCDYLIDKSDELTKYMKGYGLIVGLESDSSNADLGNAFLGATQNHPMIKLATKLIYRNLNNDNAPEYVQYPINKFDKIIFETGPALITAAYYVFLDVVSDYGGTDDSVILPDKILFNTNWARAQISDGQKCTHHGDVDQCFVFEEQEICSIGGDLLCGTWGSHPGFFDPLPSEIVQ